MLVRFMLFFFSYAKETRVNSVPVRTGPRKKGVTSHKRIYITYIHRRNNGNLEQSE